MRSRRSHRRRSGSWAPARDLVITLTSTKVAVLVLAVLVLSGTLLFLRSPLLARPEDHEAADPTAWLRAGERVTCAGYCCR